MKNLIIIFALSFLVFSCKQTVTKTEGSATNTEEAISVTTDELLANTSQFVGKTVLVKGMVSHVCKHGGQKMFLVSSNPDKYLRINTGNEITEFPIDLEGSTVEVSGIIEELETESAESAGEEVKEHHEGDSSLQEAAYHKDVFYVVTADEYKVVE